MYSRRMTQTILSNGDKGVIGSPEHRLLRRLAASPTGYLAAGEGCTVTQLRALERKGFAALVRGGHLGVVVHGGHLTAKGERHLEALDAAAAERAHLEALAR
jgi:hypothetical protein